MYTSGIDQHKHDSVVTTYDAAGERVGQVRLPNHRSAISRYFAAFPGPHQAVVESTGRWYWLSDLLTALGVDLTLAHAKALRAIAYAKVKTDPIDSDTLALLLQAGLIPDAHMMSPALRAQRDLLRTRLRLVAKAPAAGTASAGSSRSSTSGRSPSWSRSISCRRPATPSGSRWWTRSASAWSDS